MGQLNNTDWEHVDIAAIIAGIKGDGVLTGLAVSESSTPAMSVLVASGTCKISNVVYTEASGQNLNISNGDATHPRKDIIVYDATAGNPAVVEGTPAAAPIPPNIPNGDIYLAMVHVAANESTSIVNADIDEGRIYTQNFHADTHLGGGVDEIEFYDMYQDLTLHNNSTSRTVTADTYTKYKETKIDDCPDTLRISFTLGHFNSTTLYGRIYRNGVAVGTQRIAGSAGGGIFTTWTEDIAGWSDGDLLQIYCYVIGWYNPVVKDLIIVGRNIVIPKQVENLTSQDP